MNEQTKGNKHALLQWALVAFVIAAVAGLFGFAGVSQGATSVGRTLFGLFLVVAALLGISILA
ncbi:MAG: DUF1328 domain-containing protein [Chloroflexota bacterium]|nr:DUF1328 domain-containing protein [Chloroflexota bacterium]